MHSIHIYIEFALQRNNIKKIYRILNYYGNEQIKNYINPYSGNTLLHTLCNYLNYYKFNHYHEQYLELMKKFIEIGIEINKKNYSNRSAFYYLPCNNSNINYMNYLLTCGININEKDNRGITYLYYSIYLSYSNSEEYIEYLLNNGAKISIPNSGKTIMKFLYTSKRIKPNWKNKIIIIFQKHFYNKYKKIKNIIIVNRFLLQRVIYNPKFKYIHRITSNFN